MKTIFRPFFALILTASMGSVALAEGAAAPASALAQANLSSVSLSSNSVSVLAVRISGLVCDLCINEIQASLKKLPNVVAAIADPRDGVAALSLTGPGPTDEIITKVFTNAGYSVHAVTRSKSVPWSSFVKAPTAAMNVWWGSANEQKKVLASTPANLSVCAERGQQYSTEHVDSQIWGAGPTSSSESQSNL
jgi:copper chaperone CopZ